ncbi:MAG: sugar nucleotide-binding protein [Polyangiales bacterium]
MTDDQSRLSPDEFDISRGGTVAPSIVAFLTLPGLLDASWAGLFTGYTFSAIYGWGSETDARAAPVRRLPQLPSAGSAYTTLVTRTCGVRARICERAAGVGALLQQRRHGGRARVSYPCDLAIPTPPAGQILDPQRINVAIVGASTSQRLGNIRNADACANGGWHANNPAAPTRVIPPCVVRARAGRGAPGERRGAGAVRLPGPYPRVKSAARPSIRRTGLSVAPCRGKVWTPVDGHRHAPHAASARGSRRGNRSTRATATRPRMSGSARPDAVIHGLRAAGLCCARSPPTARATSPRPRAMARGLFTPTDVVFDGTSDRPYTEEDPVSPSHDYGRAKADAERLVLDAHPDAAVVRTSLLYTRSPEDRQARLALDLAAGRVKGALFTDEIRNPAMVDDVAASLLELCERPYAGVLHLAGRDAVSRHAFGAMLVGYHGGDPSKLPGARSADQAAVRPRNCALSSERAATVLRAVPRGVSETLRRT